jgi:hypothetical protein
MGTQKKASISGKPEAIERFKELLLEAIRFEHSR